MAINRSITFSPSALADLEYWKTADQDIVKKIVALIIDIAENPFTGLGKPEPLKHSFHGKWSRRINQEHRLIYEVKENSIIIYSCRFHYSS